MADPVESKVKTFFEKYRLQKFDKGHILVLAGDPPAGVYYVTKGQIGQYDIADNGQKAIVNIFRPYAFFTMSWALNGTPNEYFYEALTDIEFRLCPRNDAVKFLEDNPDVTLDLLKRVYRGTDGMIKRTALLMKSSAKQRLIFEMITECKRSKPGAVNELLMQGVSESDLASRSGLSRETVNRELAKLKSQDLISVSSSGITIKNIAELERSMVEVS